jgi:hypothetical protein
MIRFVAALSLLAAAPAFAQETRSLPSGAVSPPATIDGVAWLAGTWRGTGIGGAPVTESYTAPAAGQMSGHFEQLDLKGGVRFYEILQIAPLGGSLVYRLKHFGSDLTGWEEKNEREEFRLVAVEPGAIHFDGLSFYRRGADAMRVVVRVHNKDGTHREMAFDYRRAKS